MIHHSHKSTKWSRPRSVFRLALVKQLKGEDVITLTEVAGRLAFVLLGWGCTKTGELAIVWRRTRLKSGGRRRVIRLSERGLPTRGGQKVHLLAKPFIDRLTKDTHLVVAFHIPSEAEGPGGFARTVNAEISKECIETMHLLWLKWCLEYDHVHMAGDGNLDFRKEWVRNMLRREFPGAHFTWGEGRWIRQTGGTHGKRLIDWTISTDPITDVRLHPQTQDTDHREYEETLAS